MSELIAASILIPENGTAASTVSPEVYEGRLEIPNCRVISPAQLKSSRIPDPRATRAMSHAAILLSEASLALREALSPFIERDPFRVGIYSAIEVGPGDYSCLKEIEKVSPTDYAKTFKKRWSPKQYLKHLPNIAPANLGIFLQTTGPIHTFHHSDYACIHALEQAEFDLNRKVVDAALVCAAFSLEEPLVAARTRRSIPLSVPLSEGAAALLLVSNGEEIRWTELAPREPTNASYGIATPLVELAQKKGCDHGIRSGTS